MADESLIELLNAHLSKEWHSDEPVSETQITEAERLVGARFPDDYREILRRWGAGLLYAENSKVVLLPLRHLSQFNANPEKSAEWNAMFFFADDEGDHLYFYDHANRLGRGAWAIFAIDEGVRTTDYAKYVAGSLSELMKRALGGETVIE